MAHTAYYQVCKENLCTIDGTASRVVVQICSPSSDPIPNERVIIISSVSPLESAVLYSGDVPNSSSNEEVWDAKSPPWTAELRTDSSGKIDLQNIPVSAGNRVFVVLPDILESWNPESDALPIHFWKKDGTVEHQKVTLASDDSSDDMQVARSCNKDVVDCLVDPRRQKEADYRSNDFAKHSVLTRELGQSDPLVIKLDQLTMKEKYQHIVDTFAAGGKHMMYAHENVSDYDNKNGHNRFVVRQGSDCNRHANRFLGYWFNYNKLFKHPSDSFNELIHRSCADPKQGGYAEFLDAATVDTEYTKTFHDKEGTMEYMRPGKYFSFTDGSLNTDGATWARNDLADLNLYSVGDITWSKAMKARQDDGRAHALGYMQDSDPDLTDLAAWQAIWTLQNTPTDDAAMLRKLYNGVKSETTNKGAQVDWDHHGGIIYRTVAADKSVTLERFTADSGKINAPRDFTNDVEDRREHFAHYAIYKLKALRPGGFAPVVGGSAAAIEKQPPRFMRWAGPR